MSAVDTRPVPVSLLRWPRTRDLITQHKCILLYLWCHPQQTAAGCYLLPIDATAADLSMTSASLMDALAEFERRGLILFSHDTGELAIPDWFRWYFPKTAAARGAVAAAIARISSSSLREKVEKSYKSMSEGRKEKVKVKEAAAPRARTRVHAREDPPAPGGGGAAAAPQQKQQAKARRRRPSGIVTWNDCDIEEAQRLEQQHDASVISQAVKSLDDQGLETVPGRVGREIERLERARAAAAAAAARQAAAAHAAASPPDPEAAAKGREFISKIRARRREHETVL